MIVCAFNQERFIEEAVEAAFAQDYPNLEIILSDDGSSDSTLAIMTRLAGGYRGPHSIALNPRRGGDGVLAHVYDAAARCTGSLIVGAAGDDVSYPNRVSSLVAAWQRTGAAAICSGFQLIDEHGRALDGPNLPIAGYDPSPYFVGSRTHQISGATAAYDRQVFEAIQPPGVPVSSEDYFFSLMLALRMQKVEQLDEILVAYRRHSDALSSSGERVRDAEIAAARTAAWAGQLLRLVEIYADDPALIDQSWGSPAQIDRRALQRDIEFYDYMGSWLNANWMRRWFSSIRQLGGTHSKWLLARLFGVRGLIALRKLQRVRRLPSGRTAKG